MFVGTVSSKISIFSPATTTMSGPNDVTTIFEGPVAGGESLYYSRQDQRIHENYQELSSDR